MQHNEHGSSMDNELRLIRYLYGEEEDAEGVEQLLAADRALHTEYRQLKATKDRLDARERPRPDAAVVDRIVAAARTQSDARPPRAHRADRKDRKPAARSRTPWSRVLAVTSTLAVLLVAITVGVWQWEGLVSDAVTTEAVVDASSVNQERDALSTTSEQAAIPAWDEADAELVRLHHYIETLQARSSPSSWDSPGAALQPASHVRPSSR